MRIFNGTNSVLTLPLTGNQQLVVLPKSVSQEFMGSTNFLSMVVTSFSCDEVAFVVSGPYEINQCSSIPTAVNYVVQTLDEAIIKFGLKKEEPKCECEKCTCEEEEKQLVEEKPEETIPAETVEEEPIAEEETLDIQEEAQPEIVVEEKPKRKKKKAKN